MTDHFHDEVVGPNRRPGREGITYGMCVRIVREGRYSAEQLGEGVFWGYVEELPGVIRWVKVVTDLRAEALIMAHKDRDFQRRRRRGEE